MKKNDLTYNKREKIVSKKKHETAKKEKRLEKHGFFAIKGGFGWLTKGTGRTVPKYHLLLPTNRKLWILLVPLH